MLQPLYFAREDTRTPFRYAVVAMVVNAVAAVGFAMLLGFIGAAIGTTLAAWAMVLAAAAGDAATWAIVARFDDRFQETPVADRGDLRS